MFRKKSCCGVKVSFGALISVFEVDNNTVFSLFQNGFSAMMKSTFYTDKQVTGGDLHSLTVDASHQFIFPISLA